MAEGARAGSSSRAPRVRARPSPLPRLAEVEPSAEAPHRTGAHAGATVPAAPPNRAPYEAPASSPGFAAPGTKPREAGRSQPLPGVDSDAGTLVPALEGVEHDAPPEAGSVEDAAAPSPAAATATSPAARAPGSAPLLSAEQLLELHYFMKLNRRVEERLVNLYRQGKVVGGLYRSLGQEAVSVGAAYALEHGDLLAPLIRDLGAILVRGYSPRDCFAQYLARSTGPTLGRDGVIHMGEIGGRGIVGGMGMLGSLVSVLAGCGLAFKMLRHDRVCMTFIGDGGASTSGFHEGLHLAAARKLPLILLIENNGYAYSTPISKQTNEPDFSTRGRAFGCPGESVDGNDVLAVYQAARRAVERARAGQGPSVIEARTFRMKGHAEHDDASYVPESRFGEWRKKDPISRFETWLLAEGIVGSEGLDRIASRIEETLDADVRWAEESPDPAPDRALAGVYAIDTPFAPPPYGWPPGQDR